MNNYQYIFTGSDFKGWVFNRLGFTGWLLALLVLSSCTTIAQRQEPDQVADGDIFFLSTQGVLQTGIGERMLCGVGVDFTTLVRPDYRSPTVIFNEQGKIVETVSVPSLVWQISPTMILIDSAAKSATTKNRRLITLDGSYSYTTNMIPLDIGNGILACYIDRKIVGYMTTSFEQIDDIGAWLGFDFGDNEFVGFVKGTTIPIVHHLDESGRSARRRIMLADGSLTPESLFVRYSRYSLSKHLGLVVVRESPSHRAWIMDPTTGELLQEVKDQSSVVAGSELLIFQKPDEANYSVFTPEFEWIVDLPLKVSPRGVTSTGILICYDHRDFSSQVVKNNRAFRVHRGDSTNEARIEMVDQSSYFAIDATHWDHWVKGWTEDHATVLLDGSLNKVTELPADSYLLRLTRAGTMLCGSRYSYGSEFNLYSKQGELIRAFNTRELFPDQMQFPE